MPGAMHRMGVYLGLVEDDDYAESGDYAGHPEPERMPARRDEPATRYARPARAPEQAAARATARRAGSAPTPAGDGTTPAPTPARPRAPRPPTARPRPDPPPPHAPPARPAPGGRRTALMEGPHVLTPVPR